MKVSQKWLKKYVDFNLTPKKFAEGLTMLGLEVEGFEDLAEKYERFYVGQVIERAKHPNADRLTLCKVDVGGETLDIVCGAPNVTAGQKVAVALVGATIPHDQHDPKGNPFVLTKAKIRGVESNGMICSAFELGLGDDAEGILVLDQRAKVGMPLAAYLNRNDVIFEIGVTPNRGDCLSHIGIAREVAILVNKKIKLPSIRLTEGDETASKAASIKIVDPKRCPRYCARIVRNVQIQPSPKWMQDVLSSIGVRPINLVVDVTNYVMMEMGQPLHAFDYDRLAGHTIIVKTARDGEKFTTLDGKERTLTADTLMICDAEKPVAIAGVMGGLNSEVNDSTTSILIESAYFNPQNIRRMSRHLGLSTEASYRFERGVDIQATKVAADRAAQLIQELGGGKILKGAIDIYPSKSKVKSTRIRVSQTNKILGTNLSRKDIERLLKKIGVGVRSRGQEELTVVSPGYRSDLVEEIDLIEEVARVYGYEKIETKTKTGIDFSRSGVADDFENELRSYLAGSGFNEILAISLQDEDTVSLGGETPVKVLNPVSVEMQALRTNLVSGALSIVQRNRYQGSKELRLFEIGNVFSLDKEKDPEKLEAYREDTKLLLLLSGNHLPLGYGVLPRKADFLDMKGEAEALLRKFCLDKYRLIYYDTHNTLTEHTVCVEIKSTYAGFLGTVKKEIRERFDIEDDVYVCELSVAALRETWRTDRKLAPLPKFPSVSRDLAFVVDERVPQLKVEEAIRGVESSWLRNVTLFDVYVGSQIGTGKKSLAYALEFQASNRTMTDEEIDRIIARIVQAVREKCNAVLRS